MIMYWSGNQFSSITIFAIPFSFVFLRVSLKATYYLYRGRFIERKRRKNATLARVSVGGDAGVVIGVGAVVVNMPSLMMSLSAFSLASLLFAFLLVTTCGCWPR